MDARDWRSAAAETLAPLLGHEIHRWRTRLDWDTTSVWTRVEAARRDGVLPGLIVRDGAGRVRGWSFHLLLDGTLQVGALVTDDRETTAAWLEALRDTPEALAAARWLCFGWLDSPGVHDALTHAGLTVHRYHYLRRDLTDGQERDVTITAEAAARCSCRPWRADDLAAAPALLASAYPGADPARPFAPGGHLDEWETYLRQMVESDANGVFAPALSLVVEDAGELVAAALVTRLSSSTAHIAQFAVRSDRHGRGLGRALLTRTLAAARAAGCGVVTLLVSEHNPRARALYAGAGFTESETFLSAAGVPSFPGQPEGRTLRMGRHTENQTLRIATRQKS